MDLSSTQMLATGMMQREVMRKYLLGSEFMCSINFAADFDEQCSKEDDWDVDTTLYYDPGIIAKK